MNTPIPKPILSRYAPPQGREREIASGLWLGNLTSATDAEFLHRANIGGILSVGAYPERIFPHIDYVYIELADCDSTLGERAIQTAFQFASEQITEWHRRGTNVLVHCLAGLSRSACAAAFYISTDLKCSFRRGLAKVRKASPMVSPYERFITALDAAAPPTPGIGSKLISIQADFHVPAMSMPPAIPAWRMRKVAAQAA